MSFKLIFLVAFLWQNGTHPEARYNKHGAWCQQGTFPKSSVLCGFCSAFSLELEPLRWCRGHDTGLAVHPGHTAPFPVKMTSILHQEVLSCILLAPAPYLPWAVQTNMNHVSQQTNKYSRGWVLSIDLVFCKFSWDCIMYLSQSSTSYNALSHSIWGRTHRAVRISWSQGVLTWWG